MRKDLLMAAQAGFFDMYPLGFEDEGMKEIKKKHNVEKIQLFVKENFAKENFGFTEVVLDNMVKIISRSSMVSMFEKPKFRDFCNTLPPEKKELFVGGYYELLHGDQETGFNQMLGILIEGKLAKWSILSAFLYYASPEDEVFLKPTTVKNIINTFELEGLTYKPRPSYDFYVAYRKQLLEMKAMCDSRIGKDNAGFSGFLMMMMPKP